MQQIKTTLPVSLIENISAHAQRLGISSEKLWLIIFHVFLYRLTQENRILVTVPAEAEGSWNVFSVDFTPALRLSELIELGPALETGTPSTPIFFQFGNAINRPLPSDLAPSLVLQLAGAATWSFDLSHYSPEEIAAIPDAFIHLSENLARDFSQPCSKVSMVSENQLAEMRAWNRTEAEFPSAANLHELISAQAQRFPARIAAVYDGKRLSYADMEKRANVLAHALIATGVSPGQVVGLYLERNLDLLAAQLAILKSGAAYAALDLQYPHEMLSRLFENFDLPFILTHSELAGSIQKRKSKLVLIDQLLAQQDLPATSPEVAVDSDSTAFIIFTSGSTGVPKGVIHTHRNLIARFQAAWALAPMTAEDIVSQTSPLSSIDAVDEIYSPFLLGATTVMIPHSIVSDPRGLVGLLEQEGVTRMVLVPSLLQIILTAYEDIDQRLSRLKTWLIGGEALTATLVKSFYEKLPQASLINFYGLTEGDATFYATTVSEITPPVGRPVQNTHVYLLDAHAQLVPPGLPGEICLSGEGLFKEYWNRAELNVEKWLPNPFSDFLGGSFTRLFRTGDIGRWQPDGQLQYLSRRDRMVKIRSFRVELGEVEAALSANPAVKECAVRVWQIESAQDGITYQPRIVAYAVLHQSAQATPLKLRKALEEYLPEYALPKRVILLDSLPNLPNGKVDYRSLPEPDLVEPAGAENFIEPADELESYLVKLWERLLKRHPIGTQDNFFDLGGDSLLVVLMITELEDELQYTLPLAIIFHAPTIVELAKVLQDRGWEPKMSSLVPIQPIGSLPPLFCIHADGGTFFYTRFAPGLAPNQPFYGLQARGLDGYSEPFTRLEDMAAQYILEMRTVQPHGPYRLGGFSVGGIIIYEMAQQLQAQGEKVSVLAFLDAAAPDYPLYANMTGMTRKLRNLLQMEAGERWDHFGRRVGQRLQALLTSINLDLHLKFKRTLSPELRIFQVRRLNQSMGESYKPKPYAGSIHVFRAIKQPLNIVLDDTLGWRRFIEGQIYIHEVPGDHESIFQVPHVIGLARSLQMVLDEATGQEE